MFRWAVLILLILCSLTDLRQKVICKPVVFLFLAAMGILHLVTQDMGWSDIAGGMLPGFFLLAAGLATREAIGYGDGLVMMACGAAVGFAEAAGMLILGLFFSAVWSAVLFLVCHAGRKVSFPFVPFLLAAWICMML